MAKEVERKFTVKSDQWKVAASHHCRYTQGYLAGNERSSVRIRIAGDKANINIKSATLGIERLEYEYDVKLDDAREMLDLLCEKPIIDKTRYFVPFGGKTWEVDLFHGDNDGLVVAEIELEHSDETFELPEWADQDVSHDPRYYNVSLVTHPYKDWQDKN